MCLVEGMGWTTEKECAGYTYELQEGRIVITFGSHHSIASWSGLCLLVHSSPLLVCMKLSKYLWKEAVSYTNVLIRKGVEEHAQVRLIHVSPLFYILLLKSFKSFATCFIIPIALNMFSKL